MHAPERSELDVEWYKLGEGLTVIGREPGEGEITVDDREASRRHAEISYVAEVDAHRVRDLGSRNRTFIDSVAITDEYLHHGSVLRIGSTLFVYAEATLSPAGKPFTPQGVGSLLVFDAHAMIEVLAPSKLPVLINGPTGSGKEVLAKRIHERSGRSGPLVAVNCSTFSRELVGSELFGHTSGAFSGAQAARRGLFASADKGTVFLDEIAELPLDQQPTLLRVLQEGTVRPVGADRELDVDVRVIAASHQKLAELVSRGTFREDLLARLSGFTIELPPLASRKEEVLGLFRGFVGPKTPPLEIDAAEALILYDWPQNIRELKHAAERTELLASGRETIELELLPKEIQAVLPEPSAEEDAPTKAQLESLLATYEGNIAFVARALDRHRQQVYRWIKRYELDAASYRKKP